MPKTTYLTTLLIFSMFVAGTSYSQGMGCCACLPYGGNTFCGTVSMAGDCGTYCQNQTESSKHCGSTTPFNVDEQGNGLSKYGCRWFVAANGCSNLTTPIKEC